MPKKPKSSKEKKRPAGGVDLPEVERVLNFMDKHGLEEFEYEREGLRVRLKKPSFAPASSLRAAAAPEIIYASAAPAPAAPAASAPSRESPGEGAPSDLHVVKSPIVGTFYAAATPGAPPFVTPGARVEEGQVLCIIEAMKLMNEIEADVAGEVVRVFVENGHPVEYGEPLFGILPHRKK